jgi:hypothetical protein
MTTWSSASNVLFNFVIWYFYSCGVFSVSRQITKFSTCYEGPVPCSQSFATGYPQPAESTFRMYICNIIIYS